MTTEEKGRKQEAIFFDEDGEIYLVIGTTSRKRAGQLIRRLERDEYSIESGDLFHDEINLKPVKIRSGYKDGDAYWFWDGKGSCSECGAKIKLIDGFTYQV